MRARPSRAEKRRRRPTATRRIATADVANVKAFTKQAFRRVHNAFQSANSEKDSEWHNTSQLGSYCKFISRKDETNPKTTSLHVNPTSRFNRSRLRYDSPCNFRSRHFASMSLSEDQKVHIAYSNPSNLIRCASAKIAAPWSPLSNSNSTKSSHTMRVVSALASICKNKPPRFDIHKHTDLRIQVQNKGKAIHFSRREVRYAKRAPASSCKCTVSSSQAAVHRR